MGRRLVWFAGFFAIALLPRLSPLLSGAVFADDLVHRPEGHLLSYRFLNYVELLLWESVFGRDYLLGIAPKIIASLYTAALCSVLRATLMRWGAAAGLAAAIAIVIPLHPIWNTFIAWHATGVYVLSLLLIVCGYAMLDKHPIAGSVLMAFMISGYQTHVGLLPALLFAEAVLRGRDVIVRRLIACGAAIALYLAAVQIAALAGLMPWGGRGFGGVIGARFHDMLDNVATITQPMLSYYGGVVAAWRLWRVPWIVAALVMAVALRKNRVLALAAIALPLLAAAVVLPLNVPTSGPRVAAAIWIATLLSLVPLGGLKPAAPLVLAVGLLMVPVTLADAHHRTLAWRADQEVLASIRNHWGGTDATIAIARDETRRAAWPVRPIVMQNFQPVTPLDYSNVRQKPEWFFARFGFRVAPASTIPPPTARSRVAEWSHDASQRRTTLVILK